MGRKNYLLTKTRLCIFGLLASLLMVGSGCKHGKKKADAYGICEAQEIIISSESDGKMLSFDIQEGQTYQKGALLGCIDTLSTYFQIQQLKSSINAITAKRPDVPSQMRALQDKLSTLKKEKQRVENLVEANAASTKQLDDIQSEINITQSQLAATKSTLAAQDQSLFEEIESLNFQLQQLQQVMDNCILKAPITGTIVNKYIETNELAYQGKPLYKIADLTNMFIRVYITEDMLSSVRLNQAAEIRLDRKNGETLSLPGTVTWISPKAEFTPKMIQTKDERSNLVYAVKISFRNDGSAKIGMPGDVIFK